MAYSYFIYYRVAADRAENCEARVLELFSALKQSTNISGRLRRKRSDPLLWMEVYETSVTTPSSSWSSSTLRGSSSFPSACRRASRVVPNVSRPERPRAPRFRSVEKTFRWMRQGVSILFACAAHARYPLIVAANRDEAYARPSEAAAFWKDAPHVYGGRDLEHGEPGSGSRAPGASRRSPIIARLSRARRVPVRVASLRAISCSAPTGPIYTWNALRSMDVSTTASA